MKKLVFLTVSLVLGTACPKVERKVYAFDVKAKTGSLRFENIVTDSPETENGDFMEIVNQVIRGTKIEEENPGWRVGDKTLLDNQGRLDGLMQFTFDDPRGAGLYQHDKKSPYIWCASRDEEETIIQTNGTRLDDVLPGCVAWDRKATRLEVTVRTATLTGGEKSLLGPWKKWAAGEELPVDANANPFGSMGSEGGLEAFGEAFAGGLADGLAEGMASHATLTVGEPVVTGADPAVGAKVVGPVQRSTMKICLAAEAATNAWFDDRLLVDVRADGTWSARLELSTSGAPAELFGCLSKVLSDAAFPQQEKAWSLAVPLSVKPREP